MFMNPGSILILLVFIVCVALIIRSFIKIIKTDWVVAVVDVIVMVRQIIVAVVIQKGQIPSINE